MRRRTKILLINLIVCHRWWWNSSISKEFSKLNIISHILLISHSKLYLNLFMCFLELILLIGWLRLSQGLDKRKRDLLWGSLRLWNKIMKTYPKKIQNCWENISNLYSNQLTENLWKLNLLWSRQSLKLFFLTSSFTHSALDLII